MKRRNIILIAMILCCAILLNGPARPFVAYASIGGEDDSGDEDYSDIDEPGDDEDTASGQNTAANNGSASSVQGKYQGQIDDINTRLANLEKEKEQIQKSINQVKDAKEKEVANKTHIDRQISITVDEVTLILERIALLESRIEEKELEIEEKQAEYEANYAQFLRRLRGMQMNNEGTQLGAILGSESVAEYMVANEMMSRITEYDKNLMERVKRERADLEEEKRLLEEDKKLVEDDKAELEEKQRTLATQQASALLKIQDIAEQERQFLADLEKNKALSAEMENELAKIFKQIEWETNPYVGGEMTWPVPGFYQVTSEYGWRWGGADLHTGIDISGSGVHGHSIVAANSGKVAFVNTTYVSGKSYGIYLIIDHGGKVSTLYAHCSKIVVSVGDVVTKGQKIAEVGTTGWSTGPHLHFEVRVNDGTTTKHVNPNSYLGR